MCVYVCLHVPCCNCGHQRTTYRSWFLFFNCVGPKDQTLLVRLGSNALNCWAILLAQPSFFMSLEIFPNPYRSELCFYYRLCEVQLWGHRHPGLSSKSIVPAACDPWLLVQGLPGVIFLAFVLILLLLGPLLDLPLLSAYLSLVLSIYSITLCPPFRGDVLCSVPGSLTFIPCKGAGRLTFLSGIFFFSEPGFLCIDL